MKAIDSIAGSGAVSLEPCRLTGLRYYPLPYESTFSALMRLAWLNAFSRRDLADYCIGYKKNIPYYADFRFPKWVRSELIFRSLGWKLPNDLELVIAVKFSGLLTSIWNFYRLKFCPICMEGMYHSYWFQLHNLQRCPVHDCQLMATCMYCGSQTPPYNFYLKSFNNPYLCAACGKPFCGASPSVDAHEVIRESARLLEEAFHDYRVWLQRFDTESLFRIWPENESYEWSSWCDLKSIRAHYIHQVSELPLEAAPIIRGDLIVLRWNTRMFDHNRVLNRNGSTYDNGHEMRKVLRVFLHHIESWVFKDVAATDLEIIKNRYRAQNQINPLDYEAKQLAYLIVESSHTWSFGPRKGVLGDMESWNNRIPKIAYCAYLYGIYAGIYHSLNCKRRRGETSWKPSTWFRISDHLIAICDVSEEGMHSGRVIFPEIPGMPILMRFGREEQHVS